ncbi:MAG: hypothetical protein KGK15_03540 [Burkholderiales bacterium]|nr:hypothetical protein [Burkholderiales bacterium]MDE2287313.1 hypothetical protein [Burkholderiales bacterium]MDE2608481.1 hypothetical protein [Burkholderiales bacterium]
MGIRWEFPHSHSRVGTFKRTLPPERIAQQREQLFLRVAVTAVSCFIVGFLLLDIAAAVSS